MLRGGYCQRGVFLTNSLLIIIGLFREYIYTVLVEVQQAPPAAQLKLIAHDRLKRVDEAV